MEQPLNYLKNRVNDDWLIGYNSHKFTQLVEEFYLELSCQEKPLKIILAEREPIRFLAGFIAACAADCHMFLCNPNWVEAEWQQVFNLVQPDIICREGEWVRGDGEKRKVSLPSTALIMIPTGGSSGKIKFAMHTWETLTASVWGFSEYFQLKQVNSFCVLPLYHVSGLMQFMRSFITGGKLAILPFKELEAGRLSITPPPNLLPVAEFFISLVPTQLQRLLQNSELAKWLSQFPTVLLGGAPAWNELLETARQYKIQLAPTYGMTETASQVVTLKPDDFVKGKRSCGQVLPHASITIRNHKGEILPSNQIGDITIQAESLTLGYYPYKFKQQDYFKVDDLGFFDNQGYLHIVGRNSDKIITGGENVYPAEIEAAIRETNLVKDVCVIGIPDQQWGEAVTAVYIPKHSDILSATIKTTLQDKISKFKIPKYWIFVSTLPRNSQGKINRHHLQQIAANYLQTSIK